VSNPQWFKQVWFAGNHSDIGGSYSENEARLSDISMRWMTDEALKAGLKVDDRVLRLHPSSAGMQHDECKSNFVFRHARKRDRAPEHDATLDQSVYERFKLSEVLQYDEMKPYRPLSLRRHNELQEYYQETLGDVRFPLGNGKR